jgi:hypothetical protein
MAATLMDVMLILTTLGGNPYAGALARRREEDPTDVETVVWMAQVPGDLAAERRLSKPAEDTRDARESRLGMEPRSRRGPEDRYRRRVF